MCRPKYLPNGQPSPNWRRCPSHTDQTKIAERNERRRAKYQNQVLASKLEAGYQTITPEELSRLYNSPSSLTTGEISGYSGDELLTSEGSPEELPELNVVITPQTGFLVQEGLFASSEITGVLNYNNLTKDSWHDLGFQDPDDIYFNSGFDPQLVQKESEIECQELTPAESAALWFYGNHNYAWLNSVLYGRTQGRNNYVAEDTDQDMPYFSEERLQITAKERAGGGYKVSQAISKELKTPRMIKETTSLLDSALAKGPRKQRLVYRGMSWTNGAFINKSQGYANNDLTTVRKWVQKNFALGQEIIVDGYQSTSLDPDVAIEFADDNGVLFEIKTASGLNATSQMRYSSEKEVVLPRGARYMVAGIHYKKHLNTLNVSRRNITVVQLIEIADNGSVVADGNMPGVKPLTQKTLKPRS